MTWNPGSALLPAASRFEMIWSLEDECTRPLPFLSSRVSRSPPGTQHPPWHASPPVRWSAPAAVSGWGWCPNFRAS